MPTQEEIRTAFEQGEEAVAALFAVVGAQVAELAGQSEQQAAALKELQGRRGKNSRNSGKPPSSDGYGKPPVRRTESLRGKGDKPDGGQPGHEGNTLNQSDTPDVTETHPAENCGECGASLKEVEASGREERQVSDIPAIRIEVTAHRAEIKICPACGAENRGEFPEGVTGAVQYGNGVKTRAAYFTHRHFVPVGRTARIFKDLVQHRISEAPVLKAGAELSACVQPATDEVKKQLRKAEHALCNAHHLREPQYIEKQYGQPRAADMAALLREIKKAADETRPDADSLPPGQIAEFEQRYDAAVNAGYEANPRPPPEPGAPKKKGRPEQTPPLNLPNRFRDFRPQVSAFMYDFRVPFDNNQAERDVRMMKVKQKVSGSFRTVEGAERFARIRGYLSTARKNTVNIFSAIRDAFAGNPFIPSTEA